VCKVQGGRRGGGLLDSTLSGMTTTGEQPRKDSNLPQKLLQHQGAFPERRDQKSPPPSPNRLKLRGGGGGRSRALPPFPFFFSEKNKRARETGTRPLTCNLERTLLCCKDQEWEKHVSVRTTILLPVIAIFLPRRGNLRVTACPPSW